MIQNPFRNLEADEIARKQKEKAEIEERVKTLNESAKHILSSQDALKYRKDLEEATHEIIRLMINNTETDPIKFYCFAKACLLKLDAHYTILESISHDAR